MICPSCNAPNRDDAKFCKKCGQSFRVGARFTAPEAPVGADLSRPSPIYRPVPTQETVNTAEDPAFAPTQIISPQQMIEFHQRRWQQQEEQESPTLLSTPSPVAAPAAQHEPEGQDIADMPTLLITPSNTGEPIPPPPPPPPIEGAQDADDVSFEVPGTPNPTDTSGMANPYMDTAAQAEVEQAGGSAGDDKTQAAVEEVPQGAINQGRDQASPHKEENEDVTQTSSDQSDQGAINQPPTTAGDFPVLAAGTTLNERYEIIQVVSEGAEEHVYTVTDHQGYQHCWNCHSEQNSAGDEFCIDCGAELLNASYTMHEYPATKSSDTDASMLHGTIINTFVYEGRTYVIEQVQAAENAFPNGVHLIAACDSDAGDVRRSEPNEDSTLVLMLERVHESQSIPVGVFIVADGIGGHDNGEVASHLTISTIAERMVRELLAAPLASEKAGEAVNLHDEDALVSLLQGTIEDANTAICEVNQRDKTDMGSTITGFMVVGDYAYILNVGDSRTYMVRGGQIYQLTNDHSLVGQLVAGGLIQPEDVYTHPQRSQIFRSLGDKLNVQIDIFKQQLHPGDIMLSCSDGLWEMVRNPQIESILNAVPDPQTASAQLIDTANANGGEDNISAVVVFVR